MLTLLTVSIGLFVIILTGWTLTTYFSKKDSQDLIRKELTNLSDICKKFFGSLKNLIGILVSNSLSSEPKEDEIPPWFTVVPARIPALGGRGFTKSFRVWLPTFGRGKQPL